jgi:hypothetical protein
MEDPHRNRVPEYPQGMLMLGWVILLLLIGLSTLLAVLLVWLYSLTV